MAAEALEGHITEQGYAIRVETRFCRRKCSQTTVSRELVIIAADIEADLARFAGKRVYKTSTGRALKHTQVEFENALKQAEVYQGSSRQDNTAIHQQRVI